MKSPRWPTQMATPPTTPLAQENLAQAILVLAMSLAQDLRNLAQDTTVCCNIGLKFLSMSLIQNTNGFQTQMATPLAQENLAQAMTLAQEMTLAQGLRTLDLATALAQDQSS